MKRILIWGSVVVGLLLLLVLLTQIGTQGTQEASLSDTTISTDEHIKGNPDATITLVEYSDFQCPACARAYPVLQQVVDAYPDDIRLVYRHFPLRAIHPLAQLAAEVTVAAENQDKFWEMHDGLFNTQAQWSNLPEDKAREFFLSLASSLGLDESQVEAVLDSGAATAEVNADYASGQAANVSFTPSVFLNGQLVDANYAGLSSQIDALLATE